LKIVECLAREEPERADYQRGLSISYERLGILYSLQKQAEKAREAFLARLEIAERLAREEPDRVNLQQALVTSLVWLSEGDGQDAAAHLQRALSIVESLEESGRLAPADKWMINELRKRLAART
jgi:tetratricopeptide (TPR) repeat protein